MAIKLIWRNLVTLSGVCMIMKLLEKIL